MECDRCDFTPARAGSSQSIRNVVPELCYYSHYPRASRSHSITYTGSGASSVHMHGPLSNSIHACKVAPSPSPGRECARECIERMRTDQRQGSLPPPSSPSYGAQSAIGLHIAHGKLRIRQTTRRRRDVEVDSGADDDEDDVKQREEAGIVANERRRRRRWRRVCRSILPTHDRPLESALAFVMQQARARAVCVHTPKMVA